MLLSEKRKYLIFITILLSTTIASMLSTALTTALTPIAKDLGVGLETGQWLTSGFSLAMGIMMPLTAYLIRRFPTRRLYLIGILVFMLGLVVSFFANNFTVMMSGRILQALGTGLLLAMSQVVILTIFPAEKRGTVMGWYGLASGAAPVLAP
ncbi:MAG: MFS transporter [Streptococcus gallolyticus]|nr:MFS transporter [Streptococcus gallolyticus]